MENDPLWWSDLYAALAYQSRLDREEAGPKAPHGDIRYKGVLLSSRYGVAKEFADMRTALDFMSELMRRRVVSIFCDSKCGSSYEVTIISGHYTTTLVNAIQNAFMEIGGYNEVHIKYSDGWLMSLGVHWPEECDPE